MQLNRPAVAILAALAVFVLGLPIAEQARADGPRIDNTGGRGVAHRGFCDQDARVPGWGWAETERVEVYGVGVNSCAGWLLVEGSLSAWTGYRRSWVDSRYVSGYGAPAVQAGAGVYAVGVGVRAGQQLVGTRAGRAWETPAPAPDAQEATPSASPLDPDEISAGLVLALSEALTAAVAEIIAAIDAAADETVEEVVADVPAATEEGIAPLTEALSGLVQILIDLVAELEGGGLTE